MNVKKSNFNKNKRNIYSNFFQITFPKFSSNFQKGKNPKKQKKSYYPQQKKLFWSV